MRILFLTPQLPYPAHQGTSIRNWGLIQHVGQRHTVGLVAMRASGQTTGGAWEQTAGLLGSSPQPRRTPVDRAWALLTGEADLARRLWSPAFAALVDRAIAQFQPDIVQVEGLELALYLQQVRRRYPGLGVVYDAHNAEHLIQRRAWETDRATPGRRLAALYSAMQVRRLERLEAKVCGLADAVLSVSPEDAAALQRLAPRVRPVLVPNGIDTHAYRNCADDAAPVVPPDTLVFTGKMDYRPNVDAMLWFAAEVWPLIRAKCPPARLAVVGQQPAERLRQLASDQGIHLTGAVDDTRPYIAGAAVYIAPLRMGGGTRFKLLEAMALERPVVSTALGAEGFAVQSGRELLLADAPADFAEACLRVMQDQALAQRLGQAGRTFVEQHHDWGVILPALEAVYAAVGQPN